MKWKLTLLIAVVLAFVPMGKVRAADQDSPSLLKKVSRFFTGGPTPTPSPRTKRTATKKKHSPTPSPHRSASPKRSPSASPSPSATPEPSASPTVSTTETPEPSASATPTAEATTPETSETPSTASSETPEPSMTPSVAPSETVEPSPSLSPSPSAAIASPSPRRSPVTPKKGAPTAAISSAEIAGYENYPAEVRKVLDLALSLTTQNLGYKYGSADPANGGMDCSGFIYYVLSKTGMHDVPRDAREQYVWVRKAGKFQAVLGRSENTFELDALKPGDLLFWAGTYNVDRDPAITHTMIYLGREKATNQRVMVGASDGRTYKGQSRFGVSVFDFKLAGRRATSDDKPGPAFVGYARIPDLGER